MTKKILMVFLVVLLVVPMIFATAINIKTLPDHRISVIIRESGKLVTLESFHKETGSTGNVAISSEVDKSQIDLVITLKKDGTNKLISSKIDEADLFKEISTDDSPITINFIPGDIFVQTGIIEPEIEEPEINETEEVIEEPEEIVEETEIPEKKSKSLTGFQIKEQLSKIKPAGKVIAYIITIGAILGGIIFTLSLIKKRISKPTSSSIKFREKSDKEKEPDEEKIRDAEEKIKQAQEELNQVKNEEKVKQMERKMEEDKLRIERLKRGEEV